MLFVPLLVGEIVVRALVQKSRSRVSLVTTSVVTLWERLLDVSALAVIVAVSASFLAGPQAALAPLTVVALTATASFRRMALAAAMSVSNFVVLRVSPSERAGRAADFSRLTTHPCWLSALAASVAAWLLPAMALWAIVASLRGGLVPAQAQFAYASSALTGGLTLAPGGVRVVGSSLIAYLTSNGLSSSNAAISVISVRLVTAGLASVVGAIFAAVHFRTRNAASVSHFDDIADAYDAQIPTAQREALLTRKTTLMRDAVNARGVGHSGLDVGCGQGRYVARMRQLGFDVHGIDASSGQIAIARTRVDDPSVVAEGSVQQIGAADRSYDFVYCINVLHHLNSVDEQRAAFAELLRVVKPGGLLFVHEINTRNVVFRFYMGYVFPALNCIDEGTERWLLPDRLRSYSSAPVVETVYFTFMPEFVPRAVMRLFRPIERLLEASPFRVYSAHYMAIVEKPGDGGAQS